MNGESACQGAPATREPEATIAGDPDGDLIVDVLADLRRYTDDPKASAVARRLKRRKQDVLKAVRAVQASGLLSYPPEGSEAASVAGNLVPAVCPSCGAGLIVEVRRP